MSKKLEEIGCAAIVLSGGFTSKSPFYMMRGHIPLKGMIQNGTTWAEKISGVPAATISEVAREFAKAKPGCVISYRGIVGHYNGVDAERAVQMLSAITGNIDNPGGRTKGVGSSWKYAKGPKDKPKSKALKITKGFKCSNYKCQGVRL